MRINYETAPETVVQLLLREWRLRVPSLVISVLGGLANAPLQAKLGRVVQRGLLRAAKTTGAWVITNGLDSGNCRCPNCFCRPGGLRLIDWFASPRFAVAA